MTKQKSDQHTSEEVQNDKEIQEQNEKEFYKQYLKKRLEELKIQYYGNEVHAWNNLLIEELFTLGARAPKEE